MRFLNERAHCVAKNHAFWYNEAMSTQKHMHGPSYELLMNTPLPHDCTWGVLAAMLVMCNFFVVLPRFDAIDDMVREYHYYSSFIATNNDVDRDGIADNVDDTDSDGIPDMYDATPFGVSRGGSEESRVYVSNALRYSGLFMHAAAE